MKNDDSSYSLFFLIFILLTYFLSFLKARWKKQKEQETAVSSRSSHPFAGVKKAAPAIKVQKVESPPYSKMRRVSYVDIGHKHNLAKPRIQRLIDELPAKKNIVLLAEIIKPYEPLQ